jgi:serine/threonine-protein kinase
MNKSLEQWSNLQLDLFEDKIPQRYVWENVDDIIDVLNKVSKHTVLETYNGNHMFLPQGGGFSLKKANTSLEENCIELNGNIIIKPKRLTFESFESDSSWNYFRLELSDLEKSGVYEDNESIYEEVAETIRGHYEKRHVLNDVDSYKESGGEVSDDARFLTRNFNGSFVIFPTDSEYNHNDKVIRNSYDGRHNKMSSDDFRSYIESKIKEYNS